MEWSAEKNGKSLALEFQNLATFFGELLDLSAFWKALLVILEKTLMIEIWWEGGGNQDYLREEEARWTSSPPGPNDCVVIRRLVAVITDY